MKESFGFILQAMRAGPERNADVWYNDLSTPIPADHPSGIVPLMQEVCAELGIKHLPELRGTFDMSGGAIAHRNCILIGEMHLSPPSPKEILKGLITHELGHLVFNDFGKLRKKQEFRADRFSYFITGDPSALADHLQKMHEEELEILRKESENPTLFVKLITWSKYLEGRIRYGTFDERMRNLHRPMTPKEEKYFKGAIERYNARLDKVHTDASSPPRVPLPSEAAGIEADTPREKRDLEFTAAAERTSELAGMAQNLGNDRAALKLANATQRLLDLRDAEQARRGKGGLG